MMKWISILFLQLLLSILVSACQTNETVQPTSHLISFPASLQDVKDVATIASIAPKSAEYDAMKYVLNGGSYIAGGASVSYKGILEYLDNGQAHFVADPIPTIIIDDLSLRYEFWEHRWYLVSVHSASDARYVGVVTSIDNSGERATILVIRRDLKPWENCIYQVEIYVYLNEKSNGTLTCFNNQFEYVDVPSSNPFIRELDKFDELDEKTLKTWIIRLQNDVLPDAVMSIMRP
jgi:hypothetical protein